MSNILSFAKAIPLWCKTTVVLTLGIALSVWFTVELTYRLDQEYLNRELRNSTQLATEMLAGHLAEAMLTKNIKSADAIISKYVTEKSNITFLHITDEHSRFFTEWKKRPITFGEGILKYEAPIILGQQSFGTLSLYVDQNDTLDRIREHVSAVERRVALTLLAMMLFISAVVSYAAMGPIKEISDKLFRLMQSAPGTDMPETGPDELSRLNSALDFVHKLVDDRNRTGTKP